MRIFFSLFLVFVISLRASGENNASDERSYIDRVHGVFDAKVREWSVSIDGMILEIYEFFGEDNCSKVSRYNANEYILYSKSEEAKMCLVVRNKGADEDDKENDQSLVDEARLEKILTSTVADEFFLTRKLLEERDRSYVRVSYLRSVHSLDKDSQDISIRARLRLNRSKKRLKLFIEDFNGDNAEDFGPSLGQNVQDGSTAVGLEFFSWEKFGIKPKYSLGFRGIDPFVRARFSYKTKFGQWRVEPVQTFIEALDTQDSFKDSFSETTALYMDTPISDATLLRFVLDRGTQSRVKGMYYDGYAQIYRTLKNGRGLSFNVGFNGSTKYQNTIEGSTPPLVTEENRVFNYLFSMGWRENIFKKWLFYEINPGVNYHEAHKFRPNYNIYFRIDLFFGHV